LLLPVAFDAGAEQAVVFFRGLADRQHPGLRRVEVRPRQPADVYNHSLWLRASTNRGRSWMARAKYAGFIVVR
jgi:hypothetical protein